MRIFVCIQGIKKFIFTGAVQYNDGGSIGLAFGISAKIPAADVQHFTLLCLPSCGRSPLTRILLGPIVGNSSRR